ncbi:MAG: ROK family protein [Oscillospiraceae bacterium]
MTQELAEEAGVPHGGNFLHRRRRARRGGNPLRLHCNIAATCRFRRVPLRRLFHKYLNKPLYLENDGNCAAVGEYYAGAGRSSKRFVTITLGTGIGGGIIHNGKIYHGANGMAGEVGHMSH